MPEYTYQCEKCEMNVTLPKKIDTAFQGKFVNDNGDQTDHDCDGWFHRVYKPTAVIIK